MLLARTLKSSTFRLALICVVLFSTVVFGLLGYVYWATENFVGSRFDRSILQERTRLIQDNTKRDQAAIVSAINQRLADGAFEGRVYLLVDPRHVRLAGNLKAWPLGRYDPDGWTNIAAPVASAGSASDLSIRVVYTTLADGSHLLVGQTRDDIDAFVHSIKVALVLGAALALTMAAVAGIFVTKRTVGRIETINATTREIMRSDLSRRIPLRGTKDEWDQLAANLNAMLDRIEELVEDIRQVSDNVAHDLRTPLTRLQGRLEKALHQWLDPRRYQDLINDTIGDLKIILNTFSSLLRISSIETLDPKSAFREIDLSVVAGEVAELFDAAAEERGGHVCFRSEGQMTVRGDRDLLFDAISNIVDNAIKYAGGGDILVKIENNRMSSTISVIDRGPGIPASERENVFKRFYRLDHSRSSPGNGLGLSLVAAVAQLHGAHIELSDNGPGLSFRLHFPPSTHHDEGIDRQLVRTKTSTDATTSATM
jgi:signal transduction histidine kinase